MKLIVVTFMFAGDMGEPCIHSQFASANKSELLDKSNEFMASYGSEDAPLLEDIDKLAEHCQEHCESFQAEVNYHEIVV